MAESAEQIIERVHREHHGVFVWREMAHHCRCGFEVSDLAYWPEDHAAHVAAVLAAELRAAGWLVEGETEVEWGVRVDMRGHAGGADITVGSQRAAERQVRAIHGGIDRNPRLIRRTVTRSEWRVEDGA